MSYEVDDLGGYLFYARVGRLKAKQHVCRLTDAAQSEPQIVPLYGEPVGIIMSTQADAQFADFLIACPIDERDVDDGFGVRLSDTEPG